MSVISLVLGNQRIEGWKQFVIQRTLDNVCGTFSMQLVDQQDEVTNAIQTRTPCKIIIDDIEFLTGITFKRSRSESGNSTSLSIAGRDKTANIVDCSPINKSSSWKDTNLTKLVKDICKPFDIYVDDRINDFPFKTFTTEAGETAFGVIERACRERAILPITNRFGDLVLTEIEATLEADTIDSLIYGENIITITEDIDDSDRFSKYYVRGQDSGGGKAWTSEQLERVGTAVDNEVGLYRPKVLTLNNKATLKAVKDRAAWEAQLRAGRSSGYVVTVPGFFQRGSEARLLDTLDVGFGSLSYKHPWLLGSKTTLKVDKWGINKVMLIAGITYEKSNRGELTTMVLKDPRTYASNPQGEISG